jgi:hypothetical protein
MQRDAVETAPVIVGVRHDCPGGNLHQKDDSNDEEILANLALAFCQGAKSHQYRVHRRIVGMVQPELIDEQHKAERQKCEAEASPRPNEGVRRRCISDLRFIRLVLGPGPTHGRRATVVSHQIGFLKAGLSGDDIPVRH